ncbi:MAG: EpsG family protein [Oscillospiraceae bacterium]|nr:EpsG family protein [Oscillospiraceae bacterium]
MAVYLIYLFLAGVQFWFADKKGYMDTAKGKARYLMLCCAELVAVAALRGITVGADTRRYLEALEHYSKLPKKEVLFAKLVWPFDFEQGYFLLLKLCALINMPQPVFLLLVALVIYIPTFYTLYRYSKIPYISILAYVALGFLAYSLDIVRQMMALSIVLCGLRFIERKQLGWYLLLVALAATFHTTALIAVLLYFPANFSVKKYAKWIIPLELVCLFAGRPIVSLAAKLLPQYAHYFGGRFDVQGGTYLMIILLNVLLFAMLYLNHKGFTHNRVVIAALALAVVVQAVGYSMALFGRVVTYFSFFAIFAFSEIAYVMLHKPELYGQVWGDALTAKDWCILQVKQCRISLKTVLWVIFIVGLWGLVLMGLIRNRTIMPYTFFFMK